MLIIGLVGNERVGKDTFADYICDKYNFLKYNLAQPIKEISKIMFGWDNTRLNGDLKDSIDNTLGITPREFFNWLGTNIGQHALHEQFPNLKIPHKCIWSHSMNNWIQTQYKLNNNCCIIIPDIRFCHELDILIKYNATIINITKSTPNIIAPDTNININTNHNKYELDTILKKYKIHYTIANNNTLDDYYIKIQKLIPILYNNNNDITISEVYDITNYSIYI